ncbi:MAG TPA: hypothetical protein VL576_02725 [Candidatus Paceibacterota bacterium]|jgi:hypothetical protein|nr:hypothetical protein [Candidatus Paceibacterota bacterium]
MKVILVPSNDSPSLTVMLDYYQTSKLIEGEISFESCLKEAKKFLESVKSRIEEFKDFELPFTPGMYIFPDELPDNKKFYFFAGFLNFCKVVWQLANNHTPMPPSECKGVTRKALPTLADFESSEWKISRKLPDYTLVYGR